MNLLIATLSGTDTLAPGPSEKFVAGAFIFVFAVVLVYVAIMAYRLTRNQRELAELRKLVEERDAENGLADAPGFGLGSDGSASASAAEEHERAAEAIRSEHQL